MEKSANAFRTISEAAKELDVPQHVLRFWETKFKQIKPMKRGGGRRFYRPQDINLIKGIKYFLYAQGYTIKGVQKILAKQGVVYTANIWREGEGAAPVVSAPAMANMQGIDLPDSLTNINAAQSSANVTSSSAMGFAPDMAQHAQASLAREQALLEKNTKLKSILAELGEIKQIIKTAK